MEPPNRCSSQTLIINDVIVIMMPCYYNQQLPIFNVRGTKDKGQEDENEDDVGRVAYLIFNRLLVYLMDQ